MKAYSDKITVTIDLNNLTFKDIVYLSLQAEEEGSLHNNLGSLNMEFTKHEGSIEYFNVSYVGNVDDYREAYKFIIDSKEYFHIKNESDIEKLKSIDFEIINGSLNTDQVKELINSGISNSIILEVLRTTRARVLGDKEIDLDDVEVDGFNLFTFTHIGTVSWMENNPNKS